MNVERSITLAMLQDAYDLSISMSEKEEQLKFTLTEDTDLLSDVPGFLMEDLDCFLDFIMSEVVSPEQDVYLSDFFDSWGESDEDKQEYSKIANILQVVEEFYDNCTNLFEEEDNIMFGDAVGQRLQKDSKEEAPAEIPQEPKESAPECKVYSLESSEFLGVMDRYRMHRQMTDTTLESRVLEYASSANHAAAGLMDEFIKSQYFGMPEVPKIKIVRELEMVAYWVHMMLCEFDLEKSEKLVEREMKMEMDFSPPNNIKHFEDLAPSCQMLVCMTSNLVENVVSQVTSSVSPKIDLEDLLPGIHGIMAITNEVAEYCESSLEQLVKI